MSDKISLKHSITIKERQEMNITGVKEVFAFDENQLDIETVQGMLQIKGQQLHMNLLNLEKGGLQINGVVDSIMYHENNISKQGNSFLSKLFK